MIRLRHIWLVALLALAACTSTPEASRERDAEAKQFMTHPNAATIYVYRSGLNKHAQIYDDPVLYVDNRLIGNALPGGYFRVDTVPGRHLLHGIGSDAGRLAPVILRALGDKLHVFDGERAQLNLLSFPASIAVLKRRPQDLRRYLDLKS